MNRQEKIWLMAGGKLERVSQQVERIKVAMVADGAKYAFINREDLRMVLSDLTEILVLLAQAEAVAWDNTEADA